MEQQLLAKWINHPEYLNRETLYELRALLAQYPYFQTARLLYLKNLYLLHDITFGEELRKAALYVTDAKVLFYMIEGSNYIITPIVEEAKEEDSPLADRTLSLINRFLAEQSADFPEKTLPAIEMPVDVHADYTAFLSKQVATDDQQPQMKGQLLIDSFLEQTEEENQPESEEVPMQIVPQEEETEPECQMAAEASPEIQQPIENEPQESVDSAEDSSVEVDNQIEDESFFTETLAKIYIKQHRYLKALEIIKKLNLKYPKKNAYFADQIRFLEKLIINTKSE